jgi:uncharacterized protein YoxC
MKAIFSVTASAALIAFTLSVGEASPWRTASSASTHAEYTLQQVADQAASIQDAADNLQSLAQTDADIQSHMGGLQSMKDDVNKIGTELRALQAERNTLPEWQTKALDESSVKMSEIASRVEKAILTFNSSRTHLWNTSYQEDLGKVFADAGQVTSLLDNHLKLAVVQQQEHRLENKVGNLANGE